MKLSIVFLIMLLAGCVVTPTGTVYVPPVVVAAPVTVSPSVIVRYPRGEAAYMWDPYASSFYFVFESRRYHMPRGWSHRHHGVPNGYYGYRRHY